MQEAGQQNVSHATARLARVKYTSNASRDLFRYARLPVDVVWVNTVILRDPVGEETVQARLPMYDPHELLDYLWRSGKISVPKEEILRLSIILQFLCLSLWIWYPYFPQVLPGSMCDEYLYLLAIVTHQRRYWNHWATVAQWAVDHPGRRSCSFPVAVYGDEATYSRTNLEKFTALVLQSPLLHKRKGAGLKNHNHNPAHIVNI